MGNTEPSPGDPPKRRRRLPVRAELRLDDSLAANDRHPLARTSPEHRENGRLRLIAAILARIARGSLAR